MNWYMDVLAKKVLWKAMESAAAAAVVVVVVVVVVMVVVMVVVSGIAVVSTR